MFLFLFPRLIAHRMAHQVGARFLLICFDRWIHPMSLFFGIPHMNGACNEWDKHHCIGFARRVRREWHEMLLSIRVGRSKFGVFFQEARSLNVPMTMWCGAVGTRTWDHDWCVLIGARMWNVLDMDSVLEMTLHLNLSRSLPFPVFPDGWKTRRLITQRMEHQTQRELLLNLD